MKSLIESGKRMKALVVLNKIIRQAHANFVRRKAYKDLLWKRLTTAIKFQYHIRKKVKQFGATREIRERRECRSSLIVADQAFRENLKLRAQRLIGKFVIESSDRFGRVVHF